MASRHPSRWLARAVDQFLDSVEKTGDFSVTFHLKEANPRFHNMFETRWNGVYMMPKHIFETVDDLGDLQVPAGFAGRIHSHTI